jgi:hypothetical protein
MDKNCSKGNCDFGDGCLLGCHKMQSGKVLTDVKEELTASNSHVMMLAVSFSETLVTTYQTIFMLNIIRTTCLTHAFE